MQRRDLIYASLCALVVLVAIALCVPIANSGCNDDWSYTKTALDLAQTGHLVYNGWAAAMLGAQAYWAALWIKLFGFSFLVVRLSTAPLAVGCALLTYALCRRSGLPPGLALAGGLTLTITPIFIPNAASFMTEVPGLFLFLVTIYGYVRVAELLDKVTGDAPLPPDWSIRFGGWLLFAFISGMLGGTVRQITWIVPILTPIYLLIRRQTARRVRPVLLPLVVSALIAFAGAVRLSDWFNDQPYVVQERILVGLLYLLNPHSYVHMASALMRIVLTITVGIVPLAPAMLSVFFRELRRPTMPPAFQGIVIAIAGGVAAIIVGALGGVWQFPWLPNTFDKFPFLTGTAPAPDHSIQAIPSIQVLVGFSVIVIALTSLSVALLIVLAIERKQQKSVTPASGNAEEAIPLPLEPLLLFAAVYIPLLVIKSLVPFSFGVFDRYLLPVMPAAIIVVLLAWYRLSKRDQLPFAFWLILASYAYYGIGQTHDYFAMLRARVAFTDALESRGIPRTHIMAGFEYDGWTQITIAGHYNDERIENPKGTFIRPQTDLSFKTIDNLWMHTPVVEPYYVVTLVPHPDLWNTDMPVATYHCYLPPFQRKLSVQTTDPALTNVMELPVR